MKKINLDGSIEEIELIEPNLYCSNDHEWFDSRYEDDDVEIECPVDGCSGRWEWIGS